jgi:crossover junction endodeoxyribonuclease RusA
MVSDGQGGSIDSPRNPPVDPSAQIQFFCPGFPKPQGSKRHVGRGIMVESSKDLGPWREAIARHAAAEAGELRFTGACYLQACFWMPRPNAHFGTGKNAAKLKKSAPVYCSVRPDLDKLLRALCDALAMSGVLQSDALIARVAAEKCYGNPGVLVNLQVLP